MSKIEKVISRQKQKISEGQFYEAHQQLRVIASRYLKSNPPNYDAAIDLLSSGATLLLNADQGGSGGDLCMFLMEVYNKAETTPDAASKGRVLGLIRAFPRAEPTRKRFVTEVVSWSAKFGEYPAGDPELHHVAGQLYAEEGSPYDAERHLALGTRDSAPLLATLEHTWYTSDTPDTAPLYLSRVIFPYLLVGNIRAANQAHLLFTSKLSSVPSQSISTKASEARIFQGMPLLNFLTLLLLAVQKAGAGVGSGNADLYRTLRKQYDGYIKDQVPNEMWNEALEQIAEMYFGIRKPQQSNPLMDMMAGMFGGGNAGAAGGSRPKKQAKVEAPGAPAVD